MQKTVNPVLLSELRESTQALREYHDNDNDDFHIMWPKYIKKERRWVRIRGWLNCWRRNLCPIQRYKYKHTCFRWVVSLGSPMNEESVELTSPETIEKLYKQYPKEDPNMFYGCYYYHWSLGGGKIGFGAQFFNKNKGVHDYIYIESE